MDLHVEIINLKMIMASHQRLRQKERWIGRNGSTVDAYISTYKSLCLPLDHVFSDGFPYSPQPLRTITEIIS
jgi:hypothetical protein